MGYVRERLLGQLDQVDAACGFSHTDADPVTSFDILLGKSSTKAVTALSQEPSIRVLWDALQSPLYSNGSKDLELSVRSAYDAQLDDRPLPNITEVGTQLKEVYHTIYNHDLSAVSRDVNDALSPEYPLAELAFLSKATAVLEAHLLQSLLTTSTDLTPDISFWNEREVSDPKTLYYFVQTLPERSFQYAKFSWEFAKENATHSRPQFKVFYEKLMMGPRALTEEGEKFMKEGPLKALGLSLRPPPTILEIARREMARKRSKLEQAKQLQSACLGLLAQEGLITGWNAKVTAVDPTIAEKEAQSVRVSLTRTLKLTMGVIDALEGLRNGKEANALTDELHGGWTNACTLWMFADHDAANSSRSDGASIPNLYKEAYEVCERIPLLTGRLGGIRDSYGRPKPLVRYWFPALAGLIISYQLGSTLAIRWNDIVNWANNVRDTAKDFLWDWVVKPLEQVYATVRHQESRLALLGSESLSSDLESLERMVIDFASDHGVTDPAALREISKHVESGDLSIVLQHYEASLKSPLKNVVAGIFIRMPGSIQ
ncbi:Nuclear control of ATPase protein 2 [Rhizophlyctis rosea]|nr:Nuclear control of ATPase protein 2 [Rhizophlyctis rosea]